MSEKMKRLALFAVPHSCILAFCILMIFLGFATPFINGFGIDTQGYLYVGEGANICVYKDGVKVDKISLKSSTYAFAISSNDELIVAYPSNVCRMNTSGAILAMWEDPVAETYQQMRKNSNTVTTIAGTQYQKVGEFGWTKIVKNGTEEVFRLSGLSFVVKILLFGDAVSLFVNGIWTIRRLRMMPSV